MNPSPFRKAITDIFGYNPAADSTVESVASQNLNKPLADTDTDVEKGSWVDFIKSHPVMILTGVAVAIGGVYFLSVSEPETIKSVFGPLTTAITAIFSRNAEDIPASSTSSASINSDGEVELSQSSRYTLSSFLRKLFNPFRSSGVRSAPPIGDSDVPSPSVVPYEVTDDSSASQTDRSRTPTQESYSEQVAAGSLTPKEISDKRSDLMKQLAVLTEQLKKSALEHNNVESTQIDTKIKALNADLKPLMRSSSEESLEWEQLLVKRAEKTTESIAPIVSDVAPLNLSSTPRLPVD
jgi:hypothetical protein